MYAVCASALADKLYLTKRTHAINRMRPCPSNQQHIEQHYYPGLTRESLASGARALRNTASPQCQCHIRKNNNNNSGSGSGTSKPASDTKPTASVAGGGGLGREKSMNYRFYRKVIPVKITFPLLPFTSRYWTNVPVNQCHLYRLKNKSASFMNFKN